MTSLDIGTKIFGKNRYAIVSARHWAAVASAFTLPWSTSGQAITAAIFVVLALITIKPSDWFLALRSPASAVPIALLGLLLLGMSWSSDPTGAGGITHYFKLLFIPILIATEISPRQGFQIACGFLTGCLMVLVLSLASLTWSSGPWWWFKSAGIPFKDNAVQSGCFALCAFGLAVLATRAAHQMRVRLAVGLSALALLFFADIFLIYVSKTGMIETLALFGLFLFWEFGGHPRALLLAIPVVVIAVIALSFSVPAQRRLAEIATDVRANDASQETLSTASRRDFWRKAVGFIEEAPLLGHGTGSTKSLYESLQTSAPSPYGEAVPDPHNQFLAIAIQVGLLGGALLLLMWWVHFFMFFDGSPISLMGRAIVVQNIVGSLFNSHLSTVTQGTLYCAAIGLLGGLVIRKSHRNSDGQS